MSMKICRDCGAEFKRSPADRTVRCPNCRAGGKKEKTYPPVKCGNCGHVHTTLKCDKCGF